MITKSKIGRYKNLECINRYDNLKKRSDKRGFPSLVMFFSRQFSKISESSKCGTHQFDLFCTSTSLLLPLYFGSRTSNRFDTEPFVKSGILFGILVQVEVKFWWK